MRNKASKAGLIIFMMLSFAVASLAQKTADEYENLGDKLYAEKDYDGAIRAFSECVRLNASLESCYYTRGRVHSSKKDYDAAIADYTKALSMKPDDECYYMDRAEAYIKKQNYDSAIADYTQAIKIDPLYLGAFKNRGDAYVKKGELSRAIADYKAVLKIDPNYAPARAALKSLNHEPDKTISTAGGTSQTDYFKIGNQQMNDKDYDGAIKSFSECIRLNPKADGCYFNRAWIYQEQKNYEAAIADYTQVIKLVPQKETAYRNRGASYIKQENYESAIADWEVALKINPSNEKVKDALQTTREYLDHQQRLTQLSNDFLQQGNQQFGAKNYDEAIYLYTKCLDASAKNLECYYYRGLVHGTQKDYDKAIADFTAILAINTMPKVYYHRAVAHRLNSDLEASLKDFTEAIRLSPGDAENYVGRGETYIYKSDYASTIADLTQAIKLNPQEAKYYSIRGYAQKAAGNKEAAIADYKKALQINPNFAPAKQQLQELGAQP